MWHPRFTFHGFRYAEVTGWPGELTPGDVTALVLHTDMRRTGWFECSDDRVNRLHENVVWGMRGNFVGIPTDCPQRDERLGWTGDIAVFAPTATFLYDCAGVLESWLGDLAAEQKRRRHGAVGHSGLARLVAPRRGVGRRRGHRPVDHVRTLRRPRHPSRAVPEHAGVGRARAGARGRRSALDGRIPVRRLAGSDCSQRRRVRSTDGSRSAGHGGDDPLPRPGRDRRRAARPA